MQRHFLMAEAAGDNEEESRVMEKSSLSEQKAVGFRSASIIDSHAAGKITPKANGLVTISGLPAGH